MEKNQSILSKQIEKVKSFDKRLSLIFNASPFPADDELINCLNLVSEKAKYGEHFAQIAFLCEKKNIRNLDILLRCAEKTTEHPSQTGNVLRALFFNGFINEGIDIWKKSIDHYGELPSFTAQILARGLWFNETKVEAASLIQKFLKTPDGKEYEEYTGVPDAPDYINI
jgi:hypothetical protein